MQDTFINNTLVSLSLDKVCRSMNKPLLQHMFKCCPVPIVMEVIWRILHVNDGIEFAVDKSNKESLESSINRGRNLFIIPNSRLAHSEEEFDCSAKTKQTKFSDKHDMFDLFNVDLFFKLQEFGIYRNRLYTIFQICIQIKGFGFPKQFAEEWMKKKKPANLIDNDFCFNRIDEGLKLGIFLGDTGWYIECAFVLSYTYKLITTNWVCLDQNLKLNKTTQCLTKWLLVESEYHNFDEAKLLFELILPIISILEKSEDNYVFKLVQMYNAVSHYYFVLLKYNEAWSWIVKAANKLDEVSDNNLRTLVLNHKIRVASVFNQLKEANKCIKLINADQQLVNNIDDNIYANSFLNKACYVLNDSNQDSYDCYYIALDIKKNRLGFYNLQTANAFVEFAFARYLFDEIDFYTFNSIKIGIYIMQKIGLPYDNVLMLNAKRIKALIFEKNDIHQYISIYLNGLKNNNERLTILKKRYLMYSKHLHLFVLRTFLRKLGQNSLHTARSYCNVAYLYLETENYMKSEKMFLKAIEINDFILGTGNPGLKPLLNTLIYLYKHYINSNVTHSYYARLIQLNDTAGNNYLDYFGLTELFNKHFDSS